MIVTAQQGDTLDGLCQRHLGCTAGVTEEALVLNQGMAALGPVLPMGTQVVLPDSAPPKKNNSLVQLWD